MKVSIIIIGDEILLGQVTDTNSGELARQMAPYGLEVETTTVVGDDATAIREAIMRSMMSTDIVLTTGGLGPTKDDITKTVMTGIFGGQLHLDAATAANVETVMKSRGLEVNALTSLQAMVPTSCRVIQNRVGTAPIMWFERDGKVVVNMPGVPFETREMFATAVLPTLCDHFGISAAAIHRTAIVTGICESDIAEKLRDTESELPAGTHIAYLPAPRIVRLRVDSHDSKSADLTFNKILGILGKNVIATSDMTPPEILIKELKERHLTVATAESCTGGNISRLITSIPGSSEVMLGGVVSYANSVKRILLDVTDESLQNYGAVSRQVVEQMSMGVCNATGAALGIATSGIAGPGGGSDAKPVGTVWIAICLNGEVSSHCYRFPGNRGRVIEQASAAALIDGIKALRL